MFERFSDSGREVLVLAQEEARALRHNYIGTEHILLGVIREGGKGAATLEASNVTYEEVRSQVERIIGVGGDQPLGGQIPFTPRAKKSLEQAWSEAKRQRSAEVGPQHLLVALIESDGVAARILEHNDEFGPSRAPTRSSRVALVGMGIAFGLGVLVGWAIWGS